MGVAISISRLNQRYFHWTQSFTKQVQVEVQLHHQHRTDYALLLIHATQAFQNALGCKS